LGNIEEFVRQLKRENPSAAAAVLMKLLPPEPEPERPGTGMVTVNITAIPSGVFIEEDANGEEPEAMRLTRAEPVVEPPSGGNVELLDPHRRR
jgi:hypothetical protein